MTGQPDKLLEAATKAARQVAAEQRPGLWDRVLCAVGKCRLHWRQVKEGTVTGVGGIVIGWYRVYEGTCPVCRRSKLKMEKAT